MERVKIFRGIPSACQGGVNDWLAENDGKVTIVRVLQSSAAPSGCIDGMVHLTIFYEKK